MVVERAGAVARELCRTLNSDVEEGEVIRWVWEAEVLSRAAEQTGADGPAAAHARERPGTSAGLAVRASMRTKSAEHTPST